VDDGVIALEQLLARDVAAQGDAAEEAEARLGGRLLVDPRDRLELRMVGRDARAHEPERRRQRVVEVDLPALLQELVGGVEAGWAGADHGGAVRHDGLRSGRTATVTRECASGSSSSPVASTVQTHSRSPRKTARANRWIVPSRTSATTVVSLESPIATLPSAITTSAVPVEAIASAAPATTPPWTSPCSVRIPS